MANKTIIKKAKMKNTLPGPGIAEDTFTLRQIADRLIKRISKSFQEQSAEGMLVFPRPNDTGAEVARFDPEAMQGNKDAHILLRTSRDLYRLANTLDAQIVLNDDVVE